MVDIAVSEMEAERAPCRPLKQTLVKVMVDKDRFTDLQEYDLAVTLEDARKAFPDFDAFRKRNRIGDKSTIILMDKIKNEEDAEILGPYVQKMPNGWVDLRTLNESDKEKVLADCSSDNRLNGWDILTFDEMGEACASCPLAWNKGKDCIGTFGPEKSALPQIAEKYGCPIIASVLKSVEEQKMFSAEDAKELLRECQVLKPALTEEGKMAVHRYGGPVERMEMLANTCIAENCGFHFF